jgi:hypothetical protein
MKTMNIKTKVMLALLLIFTIVFIIPIPIGQNIAEATYSYIIVKMHNRSLKYDHSFGGVYEYGIIGETLVFGDLCYVKSDTKWWKTDADAEATTEGVIAICVVGGLANASGYFLTLGYIRDDSWNWSANGAPLWVGNSPGTLVETANKPAGSGDQIRKVGFTRSADVIYFFPDTTLIELP